LIAGKDDLKKAEIIILALATEVIPKAIAELEEYLTEEAILVNIATTFPHCEVNTKLKKVSAKIVGHAKEMALGEKPVIIVESDNLEARTIIKEVFLHIGSVLEGQTDIVSKINTISSKYGILAALEVKNALQELNLSEEIITAAIRNVTAGTMKAFAIGDVGPFAQAIIDKYEKGGHV
jgi:pyrroline-5-carboxylate reductase